MIRTLLLIFASISFIVVIGGAVYEHAAVVPAWTKAVPASLSMFQGEYGLAAWRFWMPVHPITLGLMIVALLANWRTPRRKYILATLVGYVAVLAITFTFFVPELIELTQTPYALAVDTELTRRAGRWEMLSLARLGFLIVLAIVMLIGLSRSQPAPNSELL